MTHWVPAAVLFVLCAAGAAGQTPPASIAITLDEAIDRGLAASRRLAEVAARGDAARAVVAQRQAAGLPQIAAIAGYTRTNHVVPFVLPTPGAAVGIFPDVPDNVLTRFDVQWPIYTAGRSGALERAARAEADASAGDLAAARADLRLEITRAYWALVTAGESLDVMNASVERMNAHLADVRNRLNAGLVPPSDLLSVEAQLSRQRMLSVQTGALRDSAQEQLAYLIGAPAGSMIRPASALETPAVPAAAEGLLATALQNRADRAALTARAGAANERIAAARSGGRPTVSVTGGFDYARPNAKIFPRREAWQDSWDAGVNLRWALFDGGRAKAEVAEAEAAARAAADRLADFDRALDLELRQRLNDAAATRAAIAAAEDGVRAAAEARRVIGERFDAGVAANTEVIDAQLALLQAELDRTQALAAARLADARLARALGR